MKILIVEDEEAIANLILPFKLCVVDACFFQGLYKYTTSLC